MQESQSTDNETESNKDLCTGLWGDDVGKNSEVEHTLQNWKQTGFCGR